MYWYWFHEVIDLLMIMLNVAWWVIAMRLTKKVLWRTLIGLFMAMQLAATVDDLLGHVSRYSIDLALYAPLPVLAVIIIWNYLILSALTLVGCVYLCVKFVRWRRSKSPAQAPSLSAPAPADSVTRREFIGTCAAVAPSLFSFGLTGIALNQLNHFRLRRFDLSIPSLPKALDGLTIAHVTDVHVGEWTHGRILRDMVDATNNLRADLVMLTGDLINYEISDLSEAISLVQQMPGRYGQWMVEGNHDLYENGLEFERRVKASGIPLLLDESAVSMVRGHPVQIFGLRWMEGSLRGFDKITAMQVRAMMQQRQPDAFPIFLAHHPHAFDAAIEANLPLTLTGHTHGGQLMLDNELGVGPTLFRYWSGLYKRGNSQLIVSNGVGNMFPIRMNAPAEIVHITLHCGEA
jgi:predicted MPP superfamily phosphohydrolase